MVADLKEEGVDHVVVDFWSRYWGFPPYSDVVSAAVRQFRVQGSLVGLIAPDTNEWVEIYSLALRQPRSSTATSPTGRTTRARRCRWAGTLFSSAARETRRRYALQALGSGQGVRFVVYEDGVAEGDSTTSQAGLYRRMAFPRTDIKVTVMPGVNTESLGAAPLGPAIHFWTGKATTWP